MQMFKDAGYEDWTIQHAFFANMGGFHLRPPDFPTFPVDSRQLFYLISHGYLEYPNVRLAVIEDKNHAEGFARYAPNAYPNLSLTYLIAASPYAKLCGSASRVLVGQRKALP